MKQENPTTKATRPKNTIGENSRKLIRTFLSSYNPSLAFVLYP